MREVLSISWPSFLIALFFGAVLDALIPFGGGATWPAWLAVGALDSALAAGAVIGFREDRRRSR